MLHCAAAPTSAPPTPPAPPAPAPSSGKVAGALAEQLSQLLALIAWTTHSHEFAPGSFDPMSNMSGVQYAHRARQMQSYMRASAKSTAPDQKLTNSSTYQEITHAALQLLIRF